MLSKMSAKKVLVVDDHSVVRKGVIEILQDELGAVEFGEADSASDAIRLSRSGDWDLVVLDISLPGRNGLDVLKEIKQDEKAPLVIVLSMHSEDQYGARALKAGADGYLTKESAPDELGRAVKRVLSGHKYVSSELAESLAVALNHKHPEAPHENLSDREYEVLCLIASGKTVSNIAEQLSLSPKTISTYRARVLEKMRMKNNAELTAYAIQRGLSMPD